MAIELPKIIGLPPASYTNEEVIEGSFPVASIVPCVPRMVEGVSLFTLAEVFTTKREKQESYKKILEDLGFVVTTPRSLKVAYIADNFPTDSFSNEYGESFLNKITEPVSEGAAEISQITGSKNAFRAAEKLSKSFTKMGQDIGGLTGQGISGVGKITEGIAGLGTKLDEWAAANRGKQGASGLTARMAQTVAKLAAGARVDFPQVWKNSGFAPSYTMTIRLYNPNPASYDATEKYIIGPLAAILLLGIPQSVDGNFYNWPFLHKVKSPGIYNLNPAFISNISVVKGGDQQQISWNQTLSIVDVRIDFGSLYGSMLAMTGSEKEMDRPTLRNYLEALRSDKKATLYHIPAGGKGTFNNASEQEETIHGEQVRAVAKSQHSNTEVGYVSPKPTLHSTVGSQGYVQCGETQVAVNDITDETEVQSAIQEAERTEKERILESGETQDRVDSVNNSIASRLTNNMPDV